MTAKKTGKKAGRKRVKKKAPPRRATKKKRRKATVRENPANKVSNAAQIQTRRMKVYRLRLQNMDYRRIAEALNIAPSTAYSDVQAVMAENAIELRESAGTIRDMELARLDAQEADINVVMAKLSAQLEVEVPEKDAKGKPRTNADGEILKRKVLRERRVSAFLNCQRTLLMIRKRRARMLGLDEPDDDMVPLDEVRRFVLAYNAQVMDAMARLLPAELRPAVISELTSAAAATGNKIKCQAPRFVKSEPKEG